MYFLYKFLYFYFNVNVIFSMSTMAHPPLVIKSLLKREKKRWIKILMLKMMAIHIRKLYCILFQMIFSRIFMNLPNSNNFINKL